jgi:hypothetical protein
MPPSWRSKGTEQRTSNPIVLRSISADEKWGVLDVYPTCTPMAGLIAVGLKEPAANTASQTPPPNPVFVIRRLTPMSLDWKHTAQI